jgi:hypothetical protein
MDAEQMDLLERLARLRDLGAISRREFRREKDAIFRALPRPAPVPLRALPAPGAPGQAGSPASPAAPSASTRPRARTEPDPTLLERAGRVAGWVLWTLFSIGGLDALLDRDPLSALSLLVAGLCFAPPLHRLLALRMALPTRLLATALGVIAALGIGTAPSVHAARPAAAVPPEAARACGEVVSSVVEGRSERAREGIARPWRKFWSDLVWARVAGLSAYEEWRATRGSSG